MNSASAISHARLVRTLQNELGIVPDYELILEGTYRKLLGPRDTVVDIGAHSGRHTAVFAELVGPEGHVHAFEPLPEAMNNLLSRGLPSHVQVRAMAVGPRRGVASFVYARGAPEESGFRVKAYNRPDLVRPETIQVAVMPLDDLAAELGHVSFIKIDAEGAELGCLESAEALIARCRPWITVEYGFPGYSAYGLEKRSLFDLAARIGYVVGDLFGAVCPDVETWEQICDASFWDWYLVPEDRVEAWQAALAVAGRPFQPAAMAWDIPGPVKHGYNEGDEIMRLTAELAALQSSTSWQLTAPLRRTVRAVKGFVARR